MSLPTSTGYMGSMTSVSKKRKKKPKMVGLTENNSPSEKITIFIIF